MEAHAAIELDAEYRLLHEEAGLLDRRRGMLVARGADAVDLLQGQLTNDIAALEPNSGCYAALLDRKGHMQADMRVLRLANGDVWLDTEPEVSGAVLRHMQMYGVGREASVGDVGAERAITSVIGPLAAGLVGAERLGREHAQRELAVEGIDALAVVTDLGLDLITAADDAAALRASLMRDGAVEVSEAALEILRVESGRPRFGKEMTTRTLTAEAGINERAVSFTKGCYIGQETVARLHYKGKPNRHLRGLRLSAPAADGEPVRLGERDIGSLGTAVVSPRLGAIALAILRREAEVGDRVEVGDGIAAEVVELPS